MKSPVATVLLTGAGGSASANVLDSLNLAPEPIAVIGADLSPVRLHLSKATKRFLLPRFSDPHYMEFLNNALNRLSVDVLHPQPDPEVTYLSANRKKVNASLFLPSNEAIELAQDKAAFAAAMTSAGVSTPSSLDFSSFDDVYERTASLLETNEKVWIRARQGAGSRAALPVSTPQQAVSWIEWWSEERNLHPADFMAAEFLPGREFAYQSIWQNGVLIAGQARERLEYLYGVLSPSGQSSTPATARTVTEPVVDETAQKAILAVDDTPNGVYCVDLKTSADGIPKVTEINAGRFFTTSNFFSHAGLNMPWMSIKAALGDELTPLGSSPLEPDLYWIRMVDMGYKLVQKDDLENWVFPEAN